MSYQPPPEQPGGPPQGGSSQEGTPTTNIPSGGGAGGYTPPSSEGGGGAGGYMPPPSGGYAPPPSGGTPTTNIPPQGGQGGYTPPQGGQGGYTPPPSGGYTPPPPGGYTPPPPGGYTPPPPGGGYGAPPPPPPPTGGMGPMGSMGGAGGVDFNDLIQGYRGAVMTPNTPFYESQIPKANFLKILVGLGIVVVVDIIMGLIASGAAAAQMAAYRDQLRGLPFDPTLLAGGGGIAGALLSIVTVPLFFFIGSAIVYGLAKMLGGQGSDFMVHSYLLSLSYVPLGVVMSVLNIIPGVGPLVVLVAIIYRQYSQGKSLEASQRMAPGRAQAAAFIPIGIVILLICLCTLLVIFGLMAAFSGANR